MTNQTNNDRSLELVASTREQRQAISRVVSAIKVSENMSFEDIFRAAHGEHARSSYEDERNLPKGKIAHKKIAPIYKWIAQNYLPLAVKLAPAVFDPSLMTQWSDFVRTHAIYGRLVHRIVSTLGLTERSSKQPIAELPIRSTDSFYFELESDLGGMAITLEQSKGKVYSFSLHEDEVSITLPINVGSQIMPRLSGTNIPDPLADTKDQGLRCYYILIAEPEIIESCAEGLRQRHPISAEKLDQIALAFKDAKPESFELHRLNVVFKD